MSSMGIVSISLIALEYSFGNSLPPNDLVVT